MKKAATDPSTMDSDDGNEAEVAVQGFLKRIEDTTRARPMVALAVAGGVGLVLARGLPKLGMLAVLGLGGAVGYAALRARG